MYYFTHYGGLKEGSNNCCTRWNRYIIIEHNLQVSLIAPQTFLPTIKSPGKLDQKLNQNNKARPEYSYNKNSSSTDVICPVQRICTRTYS